MASGGLWLYRILLAVLTPPAIALLKISDRIRGKRRPSFRQRFARELPELPAGGLWIHAVSVGEVEIARRLVGELAAAAPDLPVVVTATTATGLELARRSLGETVSVAPCPLDLPGPLGRFLDAAEPRALVVVETELWPEMLHQAGARGIATAVVNARLSDSSFRSYHRVRRLLRQLLQPLNLVLARSQTDAERFAALGVAPSSIRVTGNIKYDIRPNPEPLPWAEAVRAAAGDRPIVVAGSTMDGEETLILNAARSCAAAGRPVYLVLAPRHPERFEAVAELVSARGIDPIRRSSGDPPVASSSVFLIDTIGELARAYRLASAAFVGGSLVPTGGHNPLEPALWGVPVLSGPHTHNFVEVYDEMTAAGAAVIVEDADELAEALTTWVSNPRAAGVAGAAGRTVVEANRGATARSVQALLELDTGEDRR
jgi:3-deoxy-D-manno-octulosonic-acid transferase